MIDHLKTLSLVLLVTALIWIWAEAESLSSDRLQPRVELSASSDLFLRANQPGWSGSVAVRVRGATGALDRARRLMSEPVRLAAGVGGIPTVPGEYVVDLREALRADAELRRSGITIGEVDPPTLNISIEAIVSRPIRIKPDVRGAGGVPAELDGAPTLATATAMIRCPKRLAESLPEDAEALAVVDAERVARLRDDAPETVEGVRLVLPEPLAGNPLVVITPDRVSMVLRLKSRAQSWLLPTVPVWISLPPTEGSRWDIEVLDPFVRNVTVTGPKELIRGMQERAETPLAYVQLTSDDLERRITSKRVVFSTVPSSLKFESSQTTVAIRIRPKSADPKRGE